MARPRACASSEPFFSVSASRMNFSAALDASSGESRPSSSASAISRICGARNIPGPKPPGGPLDPQVDRLVLPARPAAGPGPEEPRGEQR